MCIAPCVCILSVVIFHMCHQATWTRWLHFFGLFTPCDFTHMCPQNTWLWARKFTLVAFFWFISTVFHQVCRLMDSLRRCIVALVAIEWSFATMPFQMLAQSISITACIVTLIRFVWLFNCVSSNASLNGQLEKLHSCTRCNWKGFSPLCLSKCGLKVFGSEHA